MGNNRRVAEQFFEAHHRKDRDAGSQLLHPDYELYWPQSGEVIRGTANWRAIFENYPDDDRAVVTSSRLVGIEEQWAVTPNYTVVRLSGEGDTFTQEGLVQYPNGEIWHYVALVEIRDGLIWRETTYFAAPFPPAEWRAGWVNRITNVPAIRES
jgi:ketosteroid isomerase-like protein